MKQEYLIVTYNGGIINTYKDTFYIVSNNELVASL